MRLLDWTHLLADTMADTNSRCAMYAVLRHEALRETEVDMVLSGAMQEGGIPWVVCRNMPIGALLNQHASGLP